MSSIVKSRLIRQGRLHDAERIAILQEFRLQREECCRAMATAIDLGAGEVAASAGRHLQHLDRIILALEDGLYSDWHEEHLTT